MAYRKPAAKAGEKKQKFELTEEQKQEIREAFDLFDTDGSGACWRRLAPARALRTGSPPCAPLPFSLALCLHAPPPPALCARAASPPLCRHH
jgi:hypothetical protein